MFKSKLKNKKSEAFTLVDVLVGTFLILVVFVGIFGAYQLGLKVTGQSKNRITAIGIANGEIEKIRNLPYTSVGIQGGFPSGTLVATENITRNSVQYTITRRVDFVVDSADGIAYPDDDCPNDYKRAEIDVSWQGRLGGSVKMHTDITPINLVQECSNSGGILSVSVFDSHGIMVNSPLIEIKDPATDQNIKTATPVSGNHYFSLPAGTYKVVVSKSGYNTERTYGTSEIATPEKSHPIVIDGRLVEISFSIDKVSSFSVDTLSPWGENSFSDSFQDSTKIAESSNVVIENGEIKLVQNGEQYAAEGYVISETIEPGDISSWAEFNYSESTTSGSTIRYQVLYLQGENWVLVPDADLPANSSGLAPPPIDLDRLGIDFYPKIRVKATLISLGSQEETPVLYSWQVSWKTTIPTPIPNIPFELIGEKIIGYDSAENEVPEYSENLVSDSGGHKNISNLEWDNYTFSVSPTAGLDLISVDPSPQPISLQPDTAVSVKLYLDSQNSLLVTIKDFVTLEPIFAASVRLYKGGYDVTQNTNENGQTYFIPLSVGNYSLEIQAVGYSAVSSSVQVSGDDTITINLTPLDL